MQECHLCHDEIEDPEEGFKCQDCGEWTCLNCGDGELCNECIGEEAILFIDK